MNRETSQPKKRFAGISAITQALKHRDYRLMWASNLIAQTGDWMDQVAFSWLVYDMTHSAIALVFGAIALGGGLHLNHPLFNLLRRVIAVLLNIGHCFADYLA